MNRADMGRRLVWLEAVRLTGVQTLPLSDRPSGGTAGDLDVADALAEWGRLVAEGKVGVRNGALYLISRR